MSEYRLDPALSRIILPVKITGPKGPQVIDMMLDTGASMTTLSHEVALAVGCNPAKASRRVEIMTASSVEIAPVIVVPAIRVLGHQVKNLEVVCHDLPLVSPVDGLLGLNFLKHLRLYLDFPSRLLELSR